MSSTVLTPEQVAEIWQRVCSDFARELSPANYTTWIVTNPLTSLNTSTKTATGIITSPSAFHSVNLKKNLGSTLEKRLTSAIGKSTTLKFVVGDPAMLAARRSTLPALPLTQSPKPQPSKTHHTGDTLFSPSSLQTAVVDRAVALARTAGLKGSSTFDNFAVSGSNEMAHAASLAVAKKPGEVYNPLFLYGGVGVGKTHLMHAIGHSVLSHQDPKRVLYCTSEEFTNEIVRAIRTKNALSFKEKYRKAQLLMVDDIQFMAGKNAVQEEFFHTFNALIEKNHQVVISSDKPPQEITLLEDRLRSRFQAGLMIDIQEPSFELRTAIVLIKTKALNIPLSMPLAQMIAAKVESARKIEGVIFRLKSNIELKKQVLSQALVEDILKTEAIHIETKLRVKPTQLIKTVASHFMVKQSALKGKRRLKSLVHPRHIAMYLLKTDLNLSYVEIGRWFSNRDHTSVMHAVNKISTMSHTNHTLIQELSALRTSLRSLSM